MPHKSLKQFGIAPLFDPKEGVTIIKPPGAGQGYWVGALSAIYDPDVQKFFMYYRVRKPLDEGRGVECHVAESIDGLHFTSIWKCGKEQLDNSESIEGGALVKSLDGRYLLYVSYINAANRKWDIDVLDAESPQQFNPQTRRRVFGAEDVNSEGVKDPYVAIIGGRYYMFVHYAPLPLLPAGSTHDELHGTGNVFATEKGKGSTGLAISDDGIHFDWRGDVLPPGDHWDKKLTRVDTMVYIPPVFTIFYSGRADIGETYEDRTGLATTMDMRIFHKLTPEKPALESPHSTGALRYSDAVQFDDEIFYYYEAAREDGAHEIRLNRVKTS